MKESANRVAETMQKFPASIQELDSRCCCCVILQILVMNKKSLKHVSNSGEKLSSSSYTFLTIMCILSVMSFIYFPGVLFFCQFIPSPYTQCSFSSHPSNCK